MDAYSSSKAVPSTLSASGKDVRDAQARIRDLVAAMAAEGTIKAEEQTLFGTLLDTLSVAIDDQIILSVANTDRVRRSEQQAVAHAKALRRQMQKIVDFCEQQTGAKVDASLFDSEEGLRLPPARRRRQVTVLGMDLDRVEVDALTGEPTRQHYTSHGKYSSSDEEEGNNKAEDDDDEEDDFYGNGNSGRRKRSVGGSRRTSSAFSSRASSASATTSPSPNGRSTRTKKSLGTQQKRTSVASTQPMAELSDRLFSVAKTAEGEMIGGSGGGGDQKRRIELTTNPNGSTRRKNAGDYILDGLSTKGGGNNHNSNQQQQKLLHYTSKVPAGPDRLTLEALSCFLYSLLQSTSHLVQAERARLYVPHGENKIMKVVCAVPDAAIVCYRGGQYIAAHQGLPGAAMATGVAISVDRVNDDIRRNYLSTTLHGGGSLAADEHSREDGGGGGAGNSGGKNSNDPNSDGRSKRSGTVESIFVFPIRHSSDPSRVVGVFEFINKAHRLPWSQHDEQLCFTAARLASYWLSTYEPLLDLHQLPAFQPQASYFLCSPYRPAGVTAALAANKLGAVGVHMPPLFIARVTEMEDVPTRKNQKESPHQHEHESPSSSSPKKNGGNDGSPSSLSLSPQRQHDDEKAHPHERMKEVGSIRYVRELTAYLRELERTGRSNVAEIVATRDAQTRQVDDLIKQKSRAKALEDNNNYLREKLLETQKKLAIYMNQMHGGGGGGSSTKAGLGFVSSGGAASSQKKSSSRSLGNVLFGGEEATTSANDDGMNNGDNATPQRRISGGSLFGNGGGGGKQSAGATPTFLLPPLTPPPHGNTSKNHHTPQRFGGGGSNGSMGKSLSPQHWQQHSPSASASSSPPLPQESQPPSLETLRDFIHEAKLSLQSLKNQALLSAPPGAAASTYSALSMPTAGGGKKGGGSGGVGLGATFSGVGGGSALSMRHKGGVGGIGGGPSRRAHSSLQ